MRYRPNAIHVIMACVVLSLAFLTVGCGGGSGGGNSAFQITDQDVNTSEIDGYLGGPVTIGARITAPAEIIDVYAEIIAPGRNVPDQTMILISGNLYQCQYDVPANLGDEDETYTVTITAFDIEGNSVTSSPFTFTVPASDGDTPPDPPGLP